MEECGEENQCRRLVDDHSSLCMVDYLEVKKLKKNLTHQQLHPKNRDELSAFFFLCVNRICRGSWEFVRFNEQCIRFCVEHDPSILLFESSQLSSFLVLSFTMNTNGYLSFKIKKGNKISKQVKNITITNK